MFFINLVVICIVGKGLETGSVERCSAYRFKGTTPQRNG